MLVESVPLVVLVVLALGLLVACTLVLPRYLAASDLDHAKATPTEVAKARNDVRTTLLQGFGGMVLLLGAYLTWRQTQISRTANRDELRLSREGQLTDRFTRAVEQLGSEDVAVRVGGIYALGRIAEESETERAAIADTLSAYVRKHAPVRRMTPRNWINFLRCHGQTEPFPSLAPSGGRGVFAVERVVVAVRQSETMS